MFLVYVLVLILSGILMLAMAFSKIGTAQARGIRGVFGAGFLIYGLYLLLFFHGGTYVMFYYAFIVPILLTIQFFRERSAAKARQAMAQSQQYPGFQASQPAQGPETPQAPSV